MQNTSPRKRFHRFRGRFLWFLLRDQRLRQQAEGDLCHLGWGFLIATVMPLQNGRHQTADQEGSGVPLLLVRIPGKQPVRSSDAA